MEKVPEIVSRLTQRSREWCNGIVVTVEGAKSGQIQKWFWRNEKQDLLMDLVWGEGGRSHWWLKFQGMSEWSQFGAKDGAAVCIPRGHLISLPVEPLSVPWCLILLISRSLVLSPRTESPRILDMWGSNLRSWSLRHQRPSLTISSCLKMLFLAHSRCSES